MKEREISFSGAKTFECIATSIFNMSQGSEKDLYIHIVITIIPLEVL